MDCLSCDEKLSELLDNADGAEQADVRSHIAQCPDCAARYRELAQVVAAVRSLPKVKPPRRLYRSIMHGLDAVDGSPTGIRAYWQPAMALASMTACVAVLLWVVVLAPVQPDTAISFAGTYEPAFTERGVRTGTERPPGPVVGHSGDVNVPVMPQRAAAGAVNGNMPRRSGPVDSAAQPVYTGSTLEFGPLPTLGRWGVRRPEFATPPAPGGRAFGSGLPQPVPAAGMNGAKPTGTLSYDETLHRFEAHSPLRPGPGPVQLVFTPPDARIVGTPLAGELRVTGEAEAHVRIRVQSRRGLVVTNALDGLLYEGALRRSQDLVLPVRMMALSAGTQRLRLILESDVPGVEARVEAFVPGFEGEITETGRYSVNYLFRETPVEKAIRQMAAAAGAYVVIEEDISDQRVNMDFSAGVPFEAALQVLCDDTGLSYSVKDGVYHIQR